MQASADATPHDSAVEPQRSRLPVNPRRVKVAPEERKRVVRACNACNVRRVRCSGEQPCERCLRTTRECEYPAPESDKGALKSEVDRLRKRCAKLEKELHKVVQSTRPDSAADVFAHGGRSHSTTSPTPPAYQGLSFHGPSPGHDIDGQLLRDPDGTVRYLGETSGATFLDHLKKFMNVMVPMTCCPNQGANGSSFMTSIGHYQTFDSRPLPNPNVDPLWLPLRTEMITMLTTMRDYVSDGNGDFPCGGIYWWGDLNVLPTSGVSSASLSAMTTDDSSRYLAFHHVCFALASSIGHHSFRLSEQHSGGEAYFTRARVLIGNPLDTVRFSLTDVPVLSLMAFYLIEINRRDTAYMYVGLAVRIAEIHGSFRSCQQESFKRVLWTLYVVDRWLSVLMGRPPAINDEAVKLALPMDDVSMPSCAGLRAHVELSRISNYIVCETFNIAPRDFQPGQSTSKIDSALKMLRDWKERLPHFMQMPDSLDNPDSSCCILHMAHNQLLVLTTRPILFAFVKQAVSQRVVHGKQNTQESSLGPHIPACSNTAYRNLRLAQRLMRTGRKMLQAGLHCIFNAAVILLLNRLMRRTPRAEPIKTDVHGASGTSEEEAFEFSIQFAIETFQAEARTGTHYPRDCCRVLQDLDVLTDRYLVWQAQAYSPQYGPTDHFADEPDTVGAPKRCFDEGNAIYAEMMSWEQSNGLQLQNSLFI